MRLQPDTGHQDGSQDQHVTQRDRLGEREGEKTQVVRYVLKMTQVLNLCGRLTETRVLTSGIIHNNGMLIWLKNIMTCFGWMLDWVMGAHSSAMMGCRWDP